MKSIKIKGARSIDEIETINRWLARERIPAIAYRLPRSTLATPSRDLSQRELHELIGIVLDPELNAAYARNLPPRVAYRVTTQSGTDWVTVARCGVDAMKSVAGAVSALPIWL